MRADHERLLSSSQFGCLAAGTKIAGMEGVRLSAKLLPLRCASLLQGQALALRTCLIAMGLLSLHVSPAAAETALRTTVAPTVGSAVVVHPKIVLMGEAQMRVAADAEARRTGDPVGVQMRAGPSFFLGQLVGLDLRYAYAWGLFPLNGPGIEEHRVQLGLRVGTPRSGDRGLAVANRTRLDLRGYRLAPMGSSFTFHMRPRNETLVTVQISEWFQISLQAEALLQPDLGRIDMFQLRGGSVLHGYVPLGRKNSHSESRRRKNRPMLSWVVGAQFGLSPISLLAANRPKGGFLEDDAPAETAENDHVDLVLTVGLSGVF